MVIQKKYVYININHMLSKQCQPSLINLNKHPPKKEYQQI